MNKTNKTLREIEVDNAILNLKKQLSDSGIKGDQLYVALARSYANAVMIAFQQNYNVIKK